VCASLLAPSPTQTFELDLFVNGVRDHAFATASTDSIAQGCRTVRLPAGSQVDVRVYQTTSGTVTFSPNPYWNWMTVEKVSSTVSIVNITQFTANQNQFTKVPYNTEYYDDGNAFDAGNSTFTVNASGDYRVCASLLAGTNPHTVELDLVINGVRDHAFANSTDTTAARGCRTVRLAAGNTVEVQVYQNTATAAVFSPDSYWNWMTIEKVNSIVSLDNIGTLAPDNITFTTIPYITAQYNDGSAFDLVAHHFTAPGDGDYEVCASLYTALNPGTSYEIDLHVNGVRENALASAIGSFAQGCRTVRLQAGNDVDARIYQAAGVTATIPADAYWDWMTVNKVRP
jgi:hypothetical protein